MSHLRPARPSGRLWLTAWALACGLAAPAWAAAHCPNAQPLQATAPGVWVWEGQAADIAPQNRGHVVSNVVLIAPAGLGAAPTVTVVDPGPSLLHGQALAQAVRCQWGTGVSRVLNSHAHAENVLGNSAFASSPSDLHPANLWATEDTRQAMAQRCPGCLEHITQTAGADALRGTHIVLPTHTLAPGQTLRLTDRPWMALELHDAHTHSDLALWQADTRVLIAAGLVYRDRLPELAQGTVQGWIAALDQLTALRPRTVIGQSVGGIDTLHATRQYLCELTQAVWSAMDRGWSASEAESLALPAYAHWAGYAQRQGFNAQRAWRELEPWWIEGRKPPACSGPDVGR